MPQLKATPQNIAKAAAAIRIGEIVALPTETVYGLGADATNAAAVVKIFAAKRRPQFNPLIVHVTSITAAKDIAEFTTAAHSLAQVFWPGPMTLVLPLKPNSRIPAITVAGLATIAMRMPSHPVARQLIDVAGCPIAAPSANISGRVSPTTAEHVTADFGDKVAIVLDAGPAPHGLESTIIDATGETPAILRYGSVTEEQIEAVAGPIKDVALKETAKPAAPGQLTSHYAPECAVRLDATHIEPGEALLAFGPNTPCHDGLTINLSPKGDLVEAAARLFAALRSLDAAGPCRIAVMPIPDHGIGAAINDRLKRAAAPRNMP